MLHGRVDERARLAALVDSARAGQAAVLVVVGDPGVGKSALLRDLVADVESDTGQPGVDVLSTSGVAAEAPLAFAALYRLLRPVLAWHRLPAPQARALRVAFGQEESGGVPVEPFLVGVATLSVLTEAANDRPLLCVVDDAQWLDAASANALLFAARQLKADPVAIVFASRVGDGETSMFRPDALPVLHLGGLEPAAARRLLLEQRLGERPAQDVADRLLAESGGNPLALLELPTELSTAQLAGTAPLPPRLALTAHVEQAFLDRARRISGSAQTLLLVASADDTGRSGVVRQAARLLGVAEQAWDEAERSGLLAADGDRFAVRHPLVQSAVYQAATSLQRRRVHAALAKALQEDPDRQTWHRALAADRPDAAVASALDEAAARAEQRGAHRAAADAYHRAAELSTEDLYRATRLFAAARNAWSSGDAVRARTLCTDARALTDDTLLLADLDRLRGRIEVNVGSAADAHRIFTQAAERVAHDDPVRALELAVAAAVAQSHGVDSGARLAVDTIDLVTTPQDAPRTRCLKFLLASARHDIDGDRAAALAQLHAALETAVNAPDALGDVDLLGNLANAALHLGDDDAHRRFYTLMLSTARANGDGIRVLYALQRLAFAQYLGGQWAALRSSSEEAVALGVSVGQSASTAAPRAWLALLAALQGHPDFDERLAAVEELVAAHPPVGILAQPVDDLLHWARGLHALLQGSAVEALHQFGRMQLPALTLIAAQDRIDAAIRAGSPAQAREWVRDLETFAAGTDVAWAQGAAAFGHAVAAANDEAPDGMPASQLFEASLAHHGAANRPYDRARVQLAFGEYLRRGQRRVDARTELRAALSAFEELHADPLADRARQELRASGETARKRDPSTQLDLTPMERTVAELVGQGLSNKDVAAQCWVSPRTVAFHLRNVFSKLGISSRAELAHLDLL